MEALILFNEDDQGLLRLHIPLGGVPLSEKSGIVFKRRMSNKEF